LDTLNLTRSGSASSWILATYVGTLTGTFDTVTPGYTIDYGTGTNSKITLTAIGVSGDFNNDGKVDAVDYGTWRKNEVANLSLPNDNGATTQADRFTLWRANFGKPSGTGSGDGLGSGAVPEPASLLLMLGGIAGALIALRPRNRAIN